MNFNLIPKEERPQEKAYLKGVEFLTNVELLALVLRTGSKDNNVIELATLILNKIDNFKRIDINLKELMQIKGISKVKALQLAAIFEISKRIDSKGAEKTIFNNPFDIFKRYQKKMNNDFQEKFLVLYLDIKNQLLHERIIFSGGQNFINIDPKIIFSYALKVGAARIICIHNHPSKDINPSQEDIITTQRINEIANLLNIGLLDHIIIGEGYYSFKENGII